ncbi:MAG: 2' O-ribose methyltransferase [Thelocarpon superellum]|nr:MAG: 2' O-ribose methyltransferase [Thelocarpon superellum]
MTAMRIMPLTLHGYDVHDKEETTVLESLERAYEQSLRAMETTTHAEATRRLRVENLLLAHDNDDLHGQLMEEEDRMDRLEREMLETRERLEETESTHIQTLGSLRAKARETDILKAELNALHESSAASAKLMTEKYALSHELASLKPELEHLRAQAVAHQAALSDKLALQRQVSTLQVEVETEKRAAQRAQKKGKDTASQDHEAEKQLESLRKELAKERRERERVEREAKKGVAEWEPRKAVLESKLDAMRTKLRSTKEELKETREQLEQAQAAAATAAEAATRPELTKNPRKRTASHVEHYQTIGTPDGLAGRRGSTVRERRASAMPGEKSAFSITPFLSRTSLAPESPQAPETQDLPGPSPSGPARVDRPATATSTGASASRATKPVKSVTSGGKDQDATALTAIKPNARPSETRKRARSTLENVVEEGNEENEENEAPKEVTTTSVSSSEDPTKPTKKRLTFLPSLVEETEPKKKKRKMLSGGAGKTLFDDDDGEAAKPAKVSSGASKAFPSWVKGARDAILLELHVLVINMLTAAQLRTLAWAPLWDSAAVVGRGQCLHLSRARPRKAPSTPSITSPTRRSSSSSSQQWTSRKRRDQYSRAAKVMGLRSRAAFKLLEMDDKYKIFRKGQTVVDLGYAPGSWSQVAIDRVKPHGRVLGIDIIPAQPPAGVSTIQGNFLSPGIREEVKRFLHDPDNGRPKRSPVVSDEDGLSDEEVLGEDEPGQLGSAPSRTRSEEEHEREHRRRVREGKEGKTVDVVLSDISLREPYFRMMNTSGMKFRDHAGSMDLCDAALQFAYDSLLSGGHFVCKFYPGTEDRVLEDRLRLLFHAVHRFKGTVSYQDSKEAYLVALRRRAGVIKEHVWVGW